MDISVKPNLMNLRVKPQTSMSGPGLLSGPDTMLSGENLANPLVTSLLAQSPQGLCYFPCTSQTKQMKSSVGEKLMFYPN